MNVKDNQRSRLTRMLMRNSYLRLMREKPAGKINVKEICAGAEVNRSTFYLYYAEPNDILMELEDEAIAKVVSSLQSIGSSGEAPSGAQNYLLSFLRDVKKNDELLRTLLAENSDPHFRRKLQSVALQLAATAFDVNMNPTDKDAVYLYIVSGSIELLVNWIKSGYAVSEQDMCSLLYRLCEGSLKNFC